LRGHNQQTQRINLHRQTNFSALGQPVPLAKKPTSNATRQWAQPPYKINIRDTNQPSNDPRSHPAPYCFSALVSNCHSSSTYPVLLEEPKTFDAELVQAEEAEAKAEVERARPGLTMFTDGSRLDDGGAGYAVVWKTAQGLTWKGIKSHMGSNQEAYDAECAALARALEEAARRNTPPERITIFSDAQAAIRRMASDEPGPGQKYALQARKHIATLRKARPDIIIEIRWCPAHKGVAGNVKADEWAKAAAGQPDNHGPIPRSLANLKREISKKWAEARQWAGGRTSKKKYRLPKSQRPDGTAAGCTKRLASRFYQLKTGHCLTGQYLHWTKSRSTPQCWWCRYRTQTRDHLFKECPEWKLQQRILWAEVKKETGRGKDRWKLRDLLADGVHAESGGEKV